MASRVMRTGARYGRHAVARWGYLGAKQVRRINTKNTLAMQGPIVKQTDQLDVNDITGLAKGTIDVVWIPEFCTQEARSYALAKLSERPIEDYQNAEGVGKFENHGMAYFEVEDEESKAAYYKQATSMLANTRELYAPYQSPTDKVRVTLDDQWGPGASLLRLEPNKPMYFGLMRAIKTEILPHEDKLERDDPTAIEKVHYCSQVAFNCYLKMPKEGGDLHLWDFDISTESYDRMRGDSYGIPRGKLPSPSVVIKPEEGDFVAFNGRRLHAVTPNMEEGGVRVSHSGFILYQGENKPLHFWS